MMNLKNILNKGLLILPIPFIIHNHLFTIFVDTGKNNDKNESNNNNNNNIHNGGIGSGTTPKTYEMIMTDSTGKIISTTTSTNTNTNNNNNIVISKKPNIDETFKILLVNKFSKVYKHNDIVTIIDPKNPNHTIVRRILATGNEFVPFPPYTTGIPDGCFMYAEQNPIDGSPKIVGPVPIGFITGKLITNIYPLNKLNIV